MSPDRAWPEGAMQPQDEAFMALALQQAQQAAANGEVPIGAVLVQGGQVLAAAHNAPIGRCDPTAHAEVLALRAAAQKVANYRLSDGTLYVTAEPCAMCAGAIVHARLARVVYAVDEPRTGAAGSQINVFANPSLNAHTQVTRGVLADAARAQLQTFFAAKRARHKQQHHALRDDAVRLPAKTQAALQHAVADALAGGAAPAATWQSTWHWHGPQNGPQTAEPAQCDATQSGMGHADEPAGALGAALTSKESPPLQPLPSGAAGLQAPPAAALAWRLHQWSSGFGEAAGLRSARGQGVATRAVAFVHGWGDHAGQWRHWAQAAQRAGWQVLLPDLLGHGLSDKPKRPTPDHLRTLLQALVGQLQASAWAQADVRVMVVDTSLLSVWRTHAHALGLTQGRWSTVQWRWVRRAAQGGTSATLRKPWGNGFPEQPAALHKRLAQVDATWAATWPDAGHLALLRVWLQHWDDHGGAAQAASAKPLDAQALGMSAPAFAQLPHQWLAEGEMAAQPGDASPWRPLWPARIAPPRCGAQLPALGQPVAAWPAALAWLNG